MPFHVKYKNSKRLLTKIFNELYDKLVDEVYEIIEKNCPNLTCCYDCHIDDFCHFENCKIVNNEK
jgi:hypothetical protein